MTPEHADAQRPDEEFDIESQFATKVVYSTLGNETIVSPASPEDEVCDFCARKEWAWVYPCMDFDAGNGSQSLGGWSACPECSAFIEEDDYDGLIAYLPTVPDSPFHELAQHEPLLAMKMSRALKPVYREFRRSRIGDRIARAEY